MPSGLCPGGCWDHRHAHEQTQHSHEDDDDFSRCLMSRWDINMLNDPNRPRARHLPAEDPPASCIMDEVGIMVAIILGQASRDARSK